MQRNRKQECILLSGRIFMVNFTWLIALNSLFNTKKKNKEEFNESKSTRKKKKFTNSNKMENWRRSATINVQ